MPQPSQRHAENDYRDQLDTFTDREAILAMLFPNGMAHLFSRLYEHFD